MSVVHLHLHVRDPERSAHFYSTFFGLRERVRHGDILFIGNVSLDLALAPDPNPATLPSWFHFGWRLPTADQVRQTYERCRAGGVSMSQELCEDPDFVVFRCKDLDGHTLEIYWE